MFRLFKKIIDEKVYDKVSGISSKNNIDVDSINCSFDTRGIRRANGLLMKIYFPCVWEEIFDNKNKFPTLLIQNIYQVNYTDAIGLSLDISTTEGDLSNHLIDKLRTDKFIKFITGKQGDEFISWNKSELQNFKGDQVFSKKTYSDGVTYQLVNHIFCHDKILTITYFAISSSDKNSNLLFNKNILLFNELFHRTQIL